MKDQLTIVQEECTRLLEENRALKTRLGLAPAISQLHDFHQKFGVPVLKSAMLPGDDRIELRHELIREESQELLDAIKTGNIIEIADGIADTIYVCLGTGLEFGLPMVPVWQEVHRTNMLKVGGTTRPDGKIMKPNGWQAPQIKAIIEGQL